MSALTYLIVVSGDAPPRIENNLPSEPQSEMSKVEAFEILGLPADATQQDIQKVYRDLIKKYHPDKVSHLGEEFRVIAEKKTTEINQAYELLTS